MLPACDTVNTNATSALISSDLLRFKILVPVASTLAIRTRSKLNWCETTSRRWFSLIRIKSLIRISWCSVNARMGAKPVSLRIKSASVNGVLVDDKGNVVDNDNVTAEMFNAYFASVFTKEREAVPDAVNMCNNDQEGLKKLRLISTESDGSTDASQPKQDARSGPDLLGHVKESCK